MDGRAWWATVHGVAMSRTRLHFHFHFLGFRVCHTDLEGKEKTSRESKSVFLESHQIKYPCCGISQEPVECKRVGSLEGTTMLCTQCLLMRRGREGLGEIRDTSQAVYWVIDEYHVLFQASFTYRLLCLCPGAILNCSVHSCLPSRTQICLEDEWRNDKQVDGMSAWMENEFLTQQCFEKFISCFNPNVGSRQRVYLLEAAWWDGRVGW